jgi:hypothetical protein
VVGYGWAIETPPPHYPDLQCYSSTGQLLATLPGGAFQIDDTGQLLLVSPHWSVEDDEYKIVDLTTGTITRIGTPQGVRIVYE